MTVAPIPPVETTALSPLGEAVPPSRHPLNLSPLNQRRWRNFKSNRRGYWSFWIFSFLFLISLFAELIANDRPFLIKFDGKLYFPAFINYSETTFGGDFETSADYRDPYLQKLIADKNGTIIWPLIRYSYGTHNLDLPTPAPSKPTWMLTEAQCKTVVEKKGLKSCRDLEYNWLGTDDQGRDVVARLIYGFRISVLFGLALTIISSVIGVAAGGIQGYFGGWVDLLFQRFIEVWTAIPSLYLLLILSSVLVPGFFVLLGNPAAVLMGVAGRPCPCGIPARAQLRIHPGGARAWRVEPYHHVPPSAAERDGRDHDLPAVHRFVLGDDLDGAGLPRFRPAAGLAVARRTAVAGQVERAGAVARLHRLLLGGDHAVAPDFHRRGRARRLRSAQDVQVILWYAAQDMEMSHEQDHSRTLSGIQAT